MKIDFRCYDCTFKLILELSEKLGDNGEKSKAIANEMLSRFVEVSSAGGTPPELLAYLWGDINVRESGKADPMKEIKQNSTALALKLLPKLRETVAKSENPFDTALRFAAAGNIIDYGINRDLDLAVVEDSIVSILNQPYDKQAAAELKKRMDEAKSIFYILDNCGEAVIDRLVMEPYKEKLVVGVRGKPVLNDVLREDAAESGIDFAPIVDTGDGTAGVSFSRSGKEFMEQLYSSDLVIAKGQGNFESMEHIFDRPVFYLFRAKCQVISDLLKVPFNSIQIVPRNLQ
ncbi:MAG: DUF89 family protein [Lentisphaeria bacterium]|nr:DUF89 family protein [Lentisphaeria bacterium]